MAEEPEHPIQVKAKGKKLVTKSRRLLDNIPPEFRAEAVTRVEKQAVPTETPIDAPLGASQMGSSVEMDNTTQSQKIDEFLDQELPVTLVDSVITPDGQLGTRTRILDEGIQTLTPDPTQIEGTVNNIGADRSIKSTVVVPEVFPADLYAKERPEVIPEKFRASIPLVTTRLDSAGDAAPPTLGTGDVSASSEQTKEGVERHTTQNRDLAAIAPVILTGQEMTDEQQVATVTETLDDGPQTISPSATVLQDVVEALGDGSTVRKRKTVPSVFPSSLFSKDRPEVIPVAFRSAVPEETTRVDSAGTASMPTLSVNEIARSSQQLTEFIRRETTKTRALPGSFPVITLRSFDNDLQSEIFTELHIVAMGSAYTPADGVIDYDESELDDNYTLRKIFRLPMSAGSPVLPTSYDTREPGSFYFPGLLTDIVVDLVALADTADGDPRNEVNWQPVWRPGFTLDVNFIITTSFHLTAPSPDTQYVIRTNDIVFKGVSFQISIPKVLNNSLSTIGVSFTDDALYGNLSEDFSVAASVPTASAYTAAIGSTQVLASKVTPWRRLWIKKTTKIVLL